MAKNKTNVFKQNTGVRGSQIKGNLSKMDSSDPKFKIATTPNKPRVAQQ